MRAQDLRPLSRFSNWQPLTVTDPEGFLSITFNMGIIQLPEIVDYWKTCWSLEVPFFTSVMWRYRFEQIFWLLHTSHVEEGANREEDWQGEVTDWYSCPKFSVQLWTITGYCSSWNCDELSRKLWGQTASKSGNSFSHIIIIAQLTPTL